MNKTVKLDDKHFKAAAKKAREFGKTPAEYVEALIDAARLTFDDILAPVREGFCTSGVTEEELDAAIDEARKAIHAKTQREPRK